MNVLTGNNFGILIAYLLPGFIVLSEISERSGTIHSWLGGPPADLPTIGGFLYVTIASVAAGMTVSAIRWLLLDSVHHHTGVPQPRQDFSHLQINLDAFEGAVENHYRYYQFFGNTLIAIIPLLLNPSDITPLLDINPHAAMTFVAILAVVFFLASRDALKKYYARTSLILGTLSHQETSHDKRLASPRSSHHHEKDARQASS